jgi:MoaA/NifB/PqqE/SkfB family radical SAM enzyme
MKLKILYRGPLSSCNYGCQYCPFAKRVESRDELAVDEQALSRFIDWVASRVNDEISILFTPWGEALIRPWYQAALARLTRLPHVARAAIQTNLSCRLDWIDGCDRARLALWATYHPEWTSRARFVAQVRALDERGVRLSCGAVGFKEFSDELEALRRELPTSVYLWINAVKHDDRPGRPLVRRGDAYYSDDEIARFERIDPLFRWNVAAHPSHGRACRAGASVISVDGDGTIRRCHFVARPIGNLYDAGGVEAALAERPCPNDSCGCHIGYVHLDHLGLDRVYGDGILERIPTDWSVSMAARISHS